MYCFLNRSHLLDAPQVDLVDAYTEDGKRVVIKEVGRNDEESRIARMLGSEPLQDDPRNHSVPILEVIDDSANPTKSYLVMPLLRAADDPPFDHVKEIVDFVDQMLEVCPCLILEPELGSRIVGTCIPTREQGGSPVINNPTNVVSTNLSFF